MTSEQAVELLRRYREGLCSAEESAIVERWYTSLEARSTLEWTEEEKKLFDEELFGRIMAEITGDRDDKVVSLNNRFRWWKAAAAVLLIGVSVLTWTVISRSGKHEASQDTKPVAVVADDALPGKTGAILTLANGQKILLDTTADGTIAVQGEPPILNKDGTLTYNEENNNDGVVVYNSITTPRGRQYKLVLSDGTRVWLNAASSLHYPVSFANNERKVEVSGEAYFEVAEKRDAGGKKLAFTVKVLHEQGEPAEVQVLGTHFNINAYDNEPDTRVTLLEGAVKVSRNAVAPVLIHPGQQAKISDKILVDKDVDLEMVMAWKNGIFNFKNADVHTVMRQAERWYDVKVEYPMGVPSDTLNGGISRDVKLSEFLDIIRYSDIQATIREGVIEVKPAAAGKK